MRKIILFGSLLVVFLMLIIPNVSAVEFFIVKKEQESSVQEYSENIIDFLDVNKMSSKDFIKLFNSEKDEDSIFYLRVISDNLAYFIAIICSIFTFSFWPGLIFMGILSIISGNLNGDRAEIELGIALILLPYTVFKWVYTHLQPEKQESSVQEYSENIIDFLDVNKMSSKDFIKLFNSEKDEDSIFNSRFLSDPVAYFIALIGFWFSLLYWPIAFILGFFLFMFGHDSSNENMMELGLDLMIYPLTVFKVVYERLKTSYTTRLSNHYSIVGIILS